MRDRRTACRETAGNQTGDHGETRQRRAVDRHDRRAARDYARYVHMLFEAEGITFSAFVMKRRPETAHSLLCDPANLGSKISAIAFQCGFNDLSWFNRAFRKRYAATPSAIRATALRQRR